MEDGVKRKTDRIFTVERHQQQRVWTPHGYEQRVCLKYSAIHINRRFGKDRAGVSRP